MLERNTRYHEMLKGNSSNKENNPPATVLNSLMPPQDSSFKKNKKGNNAQGCEDKSHASLFNMENKLIGSEKERRIKEGLCTYWGGNYPIEKNFKRPQNKPWSSISFTTKLGKALVGIMICSMFLTYFLQEQNCAI
ncbi:hypothetical protein O181_083530 [Austropuccinia psidii MF-1]|uniref:Uncharacterized protein n=1 Tax=Austropuccinia psidii MF-1 TaxID=1389203 RepID=A0A9Q3FTW9_9BASI|nr:hypothetical protein [Austropuccinia psidii MF-1]